MSSNSLSALEKIKKLVNNAMVGVRAQVFTGGAKIEFGKSGNGVQIQTDGVIIHSLDEGRSVLIPWNVLEESRAQLQSK